MEHEQMTYPDALRWLAKKYNIELEEEASSEEADEARNIRESLLAVNAFAAKQFSGWMWEDAVGRSVGLSYFRERGFMEETIRRFELGFHLEGRASFYDAAVAAGYQAEYLVGTGLCIAREDGSHIDRFWGRAMFPIHSLGGRIVGFGGRVLKSDAKTAKYLNSPESKFTTRAVSSMAFTRPNKALRAKTAVTSSRATPMSSASLKQAFKTWFPHRVLP